MERILVVDDEHDIAELISIYLKDEGFSVVKAENARDALAKLEQEEFHLLILDIMMPGIDGLELCRLVRRDKDIPIIFLSAKGQETDKITGLITGADDYITKPFSMPELTARVQAQLRRYLRLNSSRPAAMDELAFGALSIFPRSRRVTLDGKEVHLTPLEFSILNLLATNPGQIFSAEEIFSKVWQEKYFNANNTVMVHIRKIREKIEANPKKPMYIRTVWGVGYIMEGDKLL